MNAMNTMDVDVPKRPGLAVRLVKSVICMSLGGLVAVRAWAYHSPPQEPSFPMLAMLMCACLIAVLYTLAILTLAGRSEVLSSARFDGRADSTPAPTDDPVRA